MTDTRAHPGDQRQRSSSWSTLVTGLWIAFIVLMAFYPEQLDSLWSWLRGLPLAAEIVMWIVALPWAIGLLVWESSWDTWLRVLLVVLLAVFWTGVLTQKR